MQFWNKLSIWIRVEDNQIKINRYYCIFFFLAISINLVNKARYCFPNELLYLFTSDAFECFLTGFIAYIIYYKILPKESLRFKLLSSFGLMLLLIGLAFLKCYRRQIPYQEAAFSETMSFIGLSFIFTALFFYFDNLNLFINNSLVKTQQALKTAELQLLKQQFNPHFLFNAFNSLYSLSLQNNPKTSDSILKLSGMMRYLTDQSIISTTQLKHEFKFIQDYLEIERIRFGENANIRFESQGKIEGKFIAPLLLVTLVENAFKHGFYTNNSKAYVDIAATVKTNELIFKVKNSIFEKQHFQVAPRVGKGLENLRKRLALSYPNKADLQLSETKEQFLAVLKINFN